MNFHQSSSRLRVSASAVARVLPFAAVGDIRFYLNGVNVSPVDEGGVMVIATDGHTALAVYDREGKADQSTILPFNTPAHRRHLKVGEHVHVDESGVIWTGSDLGRTTTYISPDGVIEGKFPDLKKMFGDRGQWKPGFPGDAIRLDLLKRIAGCTGGKYFSGVRFFHKGADDQVTLFTVGTEMVGLVMPLRDGGAVLEAALPASWWAKPEGAA